MKPVQITLTYVSVNDLSLISTFNAQYLNNSGNININLSNKNSDNSINISGGNFTSQNLNINAMPAGSIQGFTGNITGSINETANSIHLSTASTEMKIGNTKFYGDPTFVNVNGGISLTGSITTNGNNLAILSTGSITVASGDSATISGTISLYTAIANDTGSIILITMEI